MAGVALSAVLWACSGSSQPSALIGQSERLNGELGELAEQCPMFLQSASAAYEHDQLTLSLTLADPQLHADDISDALVQYVLAMYMKQNTGADLDEVINTIAAEKSSLKIDLADVDGCKRSYDIVAARLKQLVKLKPMELNYNDVRTNVSDILDKECLAYAEQYGAESCEFAIVGGFAQYTLTFGRATAYANLNQASLTGRYLKELQPRYDDFGTCRTMVEDLMRSVGIDGYRFVYTDKNDTKTLSAGIPWRLIDK